MELRSARYICTGNISSWDPSEGRQGSQVLIKKINGDTLEIPYRDLAKDIRKNVLTNKYIVPKINNYVNNEYTNKQVALVVDKFMA